MLFGNTVLHEFCQTTAEATPSAPSTVTHLSSNPARRRATLLMCPTTLPLSQTATNNSTGTFKSSYQVTTSREEEGHFILAFWQSVTKQ